MLACRTDRSGGAWRLTIDALPTGIVTFLFTDIEGSTRLWERAPGAMRSALARHDDIIRGAIERRDGIVFKYVGDAIYAVFVDATDALSAALDAQVGLHGEPWPEETPIRVRMALHSGSALALEGDYVGPTLNRCARLVDLGHGSQTLLSLDTRERLADPLPPGVSLVDLGAHRLRDLARPERVFQLVHPDLPAEFPPLRSLDALPHNLPVRRSSFIGRLKEIAQVKRLLTNTRMLTLTGAGGSGKTRLALHVAGELADTYPDGVWFVPLASVRDEHLVPQHIATALGVAEEPGRGFIDTLGDFARPRQLLLILDNCEHLIDACAEAARTMLDASPGLEIMATSREALGIGGETAWRVPPMTLPSPDDLANLEGEALVTAATQYSSVRLFAVRAEAATSDFALTEGNVRAVVEVCRRLDGIPLAIELAAARVRVMTVAQIVDRLDDRFALLTGGRRDVVPRQQTLRALIDWSHDLLSDDEAVLFRRLAVFRRGWTLEAAEAICVDDVIGSAGVLDLLTRLVDRSLVRVTGPQDALRYDLLGTIHEYAWEKLNDSGESDAQHGRFVRWFLDLAERAERALDGPRQATWLARLEDDNDNLRAALAWSTRRAEADLSAQWPAEMAQRLVGALYRFWEKRGYQQEGRIRLSRVLALPQLSMPTAARAKALIGAGILACQQGDYGEARALSEAGLVIERERGDEAAIATALTTLATAAHQQGDYASARTYCEQSLVLWEDLEDPRGIAEALHQMGYLAWEQGDSAAAGAAFEKSLALRHELGDRRGEAGSLNALATIAYDQGDREEAYLLYEESLALSRELGDRRGIAFVLNNLGRMAIEAGRTAEARVYLQESLQLKREMGDKRGVANSQLNLGDAALIEGDVNAARQYFGDSLGARHALGDTRGVAESLEAFAALALAEGDAARAARWLGAASAMRDVIGAPLPLLDRATYDARLVEAREVLGAEAFAAAWDRGAELSWEDAAVEALR